MNARSTTTSAVLLAAAGVVLLGGCTPEPTVSEVMDRISNMETHELSSDGSVEFSADARGTVYVLAPRSDVSNLEASSCTVDGAPMDAAADGLNVPIGGGEAAFAFAQAEVSTPGKVSVACTTATSSSLLVLFEASSD